MSEINNMWKKSIDFIEEFLIKDEKKFNEDFSNFIKQNNFDLEQTNYFKLMLEKAFGFKLTMAHLHLQCDNEKEK